MNIRRAISQSLLEALLPAVRNKETGKLTIGKRGDYHSELIARTNPKSGSTYSGHLSDDEMKYFLKHDRGYYDPRKKKFLTRAQAGGIDSQELRRPMTQFHEAVSKKKSKLRQ